MYFHHLKLSDDPFSTYGAKRAVYHAFFQRGTEFGFDMYISSGKENQNGLTFNNSYYYNGASFALKPGKIEMDAVYDRSGGINFPTDNISDRVLNQRAFKILCNDKNAIWETLGDFMPKNYHIRTQEDFLSYLKKFNSMDTAVLKPSKGMCGKGIVIGTPAELSAIVLDPEKEYVLQEFVDTSAGIPNIVSGNHDLRIIIVNGKVVLSHIRTPKKGSLLANVAQGGSIQEIPIVEIPEFIMTRVKETQKHIDNEFNYPIYSIDFGIQQKNTPFIFELNDQIGFPLETMNYMPFIDGLLASLKRITTINASR